MVKLALQSKAVSAGRRRRTKARSKGRKARMSNSKRQPKSREGWSLQTFKYEVNQNMENAQGMKKRHDDVIYEILAALPSHVKVNVDRKLPYSRSRLRPDLLVVDNFRRTVAIAEVTCPFGGDKKTMMAARKGKMSKYRKERTNLRKRLAPGKNVTLGAIVVGSLGAWDERNDKVLLDLGIVPSEIATLKKKMCDAASNGTCSIAMDSQRGKRSRLY
ncbi:uncharacterized protein [Hetaerina americana]|uniref:uncharacterized protein n=1 Tax=Hetaerina americana TaxID=62018 RepID=UPI003A7F5D83